MQARCRALLLSLPLLFSTADALAERRELHFTAAQLTRQLAASFPQRRCLLGMACLDLRNPRVDIRPGDERLFVDVDAVLQAGGQASGTGSARLAGLPRYDARKGAFFVDHPRLLSLSVPGISPIEERAARGVLNTMLAEDLLSNQPVWVLDDSDPQQALARLALRKVEVRDGRLVLTMGDDESADDLSDQSADDPASGEQPAGDDRSADEDPPADAQSPADEGPPTDDGQPPAGSAPGQGRKGLRAARQQIHAQNDSVKR